MRHTSAPCALALFCFLLASCAHTIVTGSAEYVPDDAIITTRVLLRITPPAADRPVLTVQVVQQGEGSVYLREEITRQWYWWSPTDPAVALGQTVFFAPAAVFAWDAPGIKEGYERLPKAALGQVPFNEHRILTEDHQVTSEPTGRTTTVERPVPGAVVEIALPTGAPCQNVANDQGILSIDLAMLLAGLDPGPGEIGLQVSTRLAGHIATETVVLAPATRALPMPAPISLP